MTVYIDDAFISAKVGRIASRWCHLFADTEDELHAFAQRIGMRRSWYQYPTGIGGQPVVPESLKAQMWHYDVTEGRRPAAIEHGAVVVTRREAVHIMRARHARLFPEHALPMVFAPPEPPDHLWPDLPDDMEMRQGVRWCRRCGRMIWRANGGAIKDAKPCAVIPVTFRGAQVGDVTEVRYTDAGVHVTSEVHLGGEPR